MERTETQPELGTALQSVVGVPKLLIKRISSGSLPVKIVQQPGRHNRFLTIDAPHKYAHRKIVRSHAVFRLQDMRVRNEDG
jgi:hypothetical protein